MSLRVLVLSCAVHAAVSVVCSCLFSVRGAVCGHFCACALRVRTPCLPATHSGDPGGWLGRRRKQFETRLHKCTETRDVLPNPTCCMRTTLESPCACVELCTACSGVCGVFLSF